MAQIDKTFPTMDCSICILAPKMSEAGRHPNITLLTNSEVKEVSGYIGNFQVKVLKKARFVDEKECTACGDCADVCPVSSPNEFDVGLATRKAIYTPFAQAVPSAYIINMDDCLGDVPIACGKCIEKCEKNAINFDMPDELLDLDIGTIIVATGVDVYDPTEMTEYGYRRYENVITSLEFERLINAGGPSGGHLIRPSDKKIPKTVGFIQCVGSRNEKKGNPYCSNVCCMNTIKDSLLIMEHWPDTKIKIFYLDIRAFGKGFEDLYKRSKSSGVMYIRGLPSEIKEDPDTRNLVIISENTNTGKVEEHEVDMAVLSVGLIPAKDSDVIQRLFTLSKTSDGFFMESHPKLKPVDAPTQGVFFAGCAEGPKDIKDSVTQASAAASRAGILMKAGKIKVEAITSVVNEEICNACGLCARVCPYNAIEVDPKNKIPAHVIEAACAGCGTCGAECRQGAITMRHFTDEQILAQVDAVTEVDADKKIVAFCCNWCSYAGADFAGVSRMQYPPNVRIIRTMCSGRISEEFILHAFRRGAAAVLVAGCHLNDCHYIDANYQTLKRVEKLWKKLEKIGIDKERLQLAWISAAEGEKFASKIKQMKEIIDGVSEREIKKTIEVLV